MKYKFFQKIISYWGNEQHIFVTNGLLLEIFENFLKFWPHIGIQHPMFSLTANSHIPRQCNFNFMAIMNSHGIWTSKSFVVYTLSSGVVAQYWLGGHNQFLRPPTKLWLLFVVQCAMAIQRWLILDYPLKLNNYVFYNPVGIENKQFGRGLNLFASGASENFETMLFISLENAPSVKNLPFYCEKESEIMRALGEYLENRVSKSRRLWSKQIKLKWFPSFSFG